MSSGKWIVGFNMPGYMPDSDPHECDTFEEAKECMIEDLEHSAESADETTEEGAAEIAQIEDVIPRIRVIAMPEEIGITIGKWHYFISAAVAS